MSTNRPNPNDVYSLIGFALVAIQTTEKLFKFVTTFVLQEKEFIDLRSFESVSSRERKKALGHFMQKIRERADLHPRLDSLLKNYLTNRNSFIHSQRDIPGWDLDSEEGVRIAKTFTWKLLRQSDRLDAVLLALILQWQEQTGILAPENSGDQQFFDSIDLKYGPMVHALFTGKSI